METYHKIQTLFRRDLDGSLTGQKGKMIEGQWTTPELEYLARNEWEFTEKVDGTNIRISLDFDYGHGHVLFAGRTDNAVIPEPLKRYLVETFGSGLDVDSRWFKAFDGAGDVILFGEGYGPKIQNGGNYRADQSFVLFDVKIGPWWLNREDVNDIATKLGIDSVPVLGHGDLWDAINIVKGDRDSLRPAHKNFVIQNRFQSLWGDFEAEGIVARPRVPMFDRKGQRIITKIKAVDFR